jgi:hypothetical protein
MAKDLNVRQGFERASHTALTPYNPPTVRVACGCEIERESNMYRLIV